LVLIFQPTDVLCICASLEERNKQINLHIWNFWSYYLSNETMKECSLMEHFMFLLGC
jgi:hypothetical protein